MVQLLHLLPDETLAQLDAWAKGAPFAFTNSARRRYVLEANSIRLLRGFFRQPQIRAIKFAGALDFLTSMMQPICHTDASDNFQGPSSPRSGEANKGPPPVIAPRQIKPSEVDVTGLPVAAETSTSVPSPTLAEQGDLLGGPNRSQSAPSPRSDEPEQDRERGQASPSASPGPRRGRSGGLGPLQSPSTTPGQAQVPAVHAQSTSSAGSHGLSTLLVSERLKRSLEEYVKASAALKERHAAAEARASSGGRAQPQRGQAERDAAVAGPSIGQSGTSYSAVMEGITEEDSRKFLKSVVLLMAPQEMNGNLDALFEALDLTGVPPQDPVAP
ncbi:hypothetical protein WJX74_001710 [Apatococcus lobatus]|uniref:Uncharacterized protein n=1 Tax=Apatococcus lobatus TaxID=904363 RepID=A0AAW1QCF2_9CHLO